MDKVIAKKKEGNIGKEYERHILALIALKCLLKNDILDFWMSTNHFAIDKFDDLILHVEYKDNRKELFFMQLKHKHNGDKPIVVKMFKNTQKDFSLEMYNEAYGSILEKKEFFSSNNISEDTKRFFVVHNNCMVSMHSEDPANLCFEVLREEDFRNFISSNTSENVSTEYTIIDTETCAEFLSQFYFYAGQLRFKQIPLEIKNLIGLNQDCVNNIIKYFYDFASSENIVEKLHKQDIKTKLLGYVFGGFVPTTKSNKEYSLLTVIETFDATLIYEEDSEEAIWNEMLTYMRNYYGKESLELSGWEEPLPPNLQSKFRDSLNLSAEEQIITKHLYLHLVAKRLLPFYIESKNEYFAFFVKELMTKLEVFTVIFDSKKLFKQDPEFQMLRNRCDLKFLESVYDLDGEQCLALTSRVQISLQGKGNVPLSNFVDDENLRKKISIDLLVSLLDKNLNFGSMRSKAPIYIQRRLKVPLLNESILENGEYLFVVCGISSLKEYDSMSLSSYLNSIKMGVDEMEELEYEAAFPVLTTQRDFDMALMEVIWKIPNVTLYCVLQFVETNTLENRFIVKETNGTLEMMKSSVCEYCPMIEDEVFESNRHSKINIICNKAGMGKTMLLNRISQKFSPTEWVVQVELGKFSNEIKDIDDFDGFIKFIRNIQMITIDRRHQIIFKLLHQYYIEHEKLIILLDDYEEINDRNLLQILKIGIDRGLKIWMVGRPLLKIDLEEAFQVISMELDEFNTNDQNTFFKYYFSRNKSLAEVENKMRLVEKTRSKLESSFIGICQQTMMLADVVNSNEDITEDHIRIDDLYERFINSQIAQHYPKYRKFINRIVSKLALYSLFSKEVLKRLFDWDDFECDVEVFKEERPKTAFIMEFRANDIPLFSHKTYAEFLTAKWLADTAIKQIRNETPFDITEILKLLYCPELTNVRQFFDNILTKNKSALSAVINNDFSTSNLSHGMNETDSLGRSICHMIMSYGKRYHIHTASQAALALHNYEERADINKQGQLMVLRVPKLAEKSPANVMKKKLLLFIPPMMILKEDKLLGRTAVDYALMSGSLEELEMALSTDFFIRNVSSEAFFRAMNHESLYFILLYCIKNKFNRIFLKLLALRDIQNALTQIREYQNGMSLLHLAVEYKNLIAVKKLIVSSPTIESWGADEEQNTPLHLACQHTRSPVLSIFDFGNYSTPFFNLQNSRGWSHLHYFAHQGNKAWVEKILKNPGIKVDSTCSQGNTPFILSIMRKNLEIAAILKDNGANINFGNKHKMTALHFAASRGIHKSTQKLIEWGAKPSVRTTYGATPLIKASSWGRVKIVELLLNARADINSRDVNNWTSLHHAVKRRKFRVIQLLVDRGADLNAVTNKGHTPLITATIHNVPGAIKILTKDPASVRVGYYSTTEGGTALDIATQKKHIQCVSLLRKAVSSLRQRSVQQSRRAVAELVKTPDSTECETDSSAKYCFYNGINGEEYYDEEDEDYEEEDEDDEEEDEDDEEEDEDDEEEDEDDEEEEEDDEEEDEYSDDESDESDEDEYGLEEYERYNEQADQRRYDENYIEVIGKIVYNFCRRIFIQI